MKYQLVLQWPATSTADHDAMVEAEDILAECLRGSSDGHDAGSGEVNVFIHTDDPVGAFGEARAALENRHCWADARAAYRKFSEDEWTILFPEGLAEFNVA